VSGGLFMMRAQLGGFGVCSLRSGLPLCAAGSRRARNDHESSSNGRELEQRVVPCALLVFVGGGNSGSPSSIRPCLMSRDKVRIVEWPFIHASEQPIEPHPNRSGKNSPADRIRAARPHW